VGVFYAEGMGHIGDRARASDQVNLDVLRHMAEHVADGRAVDSQFFLATLDGALDELREYRTPGFAQFS
jgi:hypothetical protein